MDLELSKDLCDILFNNKIENVSDIVSLTELEMYAMLRKRTYLNEIKKKIEALGLSFSNREVCIGEKDSEKTIIDLNFTVKTYNVLRRNGITTIEDLLNKDIWDIFKFRCMGRRSFNEIVYKLDELGFNPIDGQIKKIAELEKELETLKNTKEPFAETIEIKSIKMDEYNKLWIVLSNVPAAEWITVFKDVRSKYFLSKDENALPHKIVISIINEIELKPETEKVFCSANDILKYDKYKDILKCFVEILDDILKQTHKEYNERLRIVELDLKKEEINEISKGIDEIKRILAERDKRSVINAELEKLIETIK